MTDRIAPRATQDDREWFADGLRFECTQCGNCCTGPPGYVWFTEDEGRAMARVLDVDEQEFFRRHARRERGRWTLDEHKTEHGFDCVLLDRQTAPGKAICSVYEARPAQCRTWPFWPENLRSPKSWARVKQATPCPGMNEGPLVPVEQIRICRDSTLDDE